MRAHFERRVIAISAERPVYWVSAETRSDLAGPRMRLTACENAEVTGR